MGIYLIILRGCNRFEITEDRNRCGLSDNFFHRRIKKLEITFHDSIILNLVEQSPVTYFEQSRGMGMVPSRLL